jgi:hypothetical protein
MTEYQNWNDSRWDYMKSQSKWHFDTKRLAQEGADSYYHVCRFDADWTDAIARCMPQTRSSTWGDRNDWNPKVAEEGLYSATAEEKDLIRAGADPKMQIYERTKADDIEIFQKVSEWLGMDRPMIKFHNQRTGQMLVEHIDNFAAREERENSFKVIDIDKNPEIMRRFAIMLDDWKLGQVFQLGNANFHQWRKGDCITWDWKNIPHATCNMGWEDRPMLQITGYVTERTNAIICERAYYDNIQVVEIK